MIWQMYPKFQVWRCNYYGTLWCLNSWYGVSNSHVPRDVHFNLIITDFSFLTPNSMGEFQTKFQILVLCLAVIGCDYCQVYLYVELGLPIIWRGYHRRTQWMNGCGANRGKGPTPLSFTTEEVDVFVPIVSGACVDLTIHGTTSRTEVFEIQPDLKIGLNGIGNHPEESRLDRNQELDQIRLRIKGIRVRLGKGSPNL